MKSNCHLPINENVDKWDDRTVASFLNFIIPNPECSDQWSVLLLVWFYFGKKTAVYGWSDEISYLQFILDFGDFQQQSPSAFFHLVCFLSVLPYFYFSGVFTILLLSHVHCVPSLTVVFSQCVTNRTYSLFFQGAWAALCSCCFNSIFFFLYF